jgi:hypothetical protein
MSLAEYGRGSHHADAEDLPRYSSRAMTFPKLFPRFLASTPIEASRKKTFQWRPLNTPPKATRHFESHGRPPDPAYAAAALSQRQREGIGYHFFSTILHGLRSTSDRVLLISSVPNVWKSGNLGTDRSRSVVVAKRMEGRAERTSLVAAGRWAFPRSSAVVAALSCVALISAGGSWVLHVQGRGEVGAALLAQAQYGDGGLSQGQGQGMVAGGSGGPVYPGEMLSINVPATQLAHSSIGEEVKGSVPAAGGGKVDFTGKIAEGTSLCSGCPVGAVTVRVISDKYVAPGTTVEGLVAGKPFTGTVTDAASDNQRLSGMEQRLSTLEGPHKKQIQDLAHELAGFESRLSKLEGHKSIKERIRDLQDRLDHLKYHVSAVIHPSSSHHDNG